MLKYAVDDAIAQAHLFVIELKLISSKNCWLCLSGEPCDDTVKEQLTLLKADGVHCVGGDKSSLLTTLVSAVKLPSSSADLLLISFSSHGFEDEQGDDAYVMPADGRVSLLDETAVKIRTIEKQLASSKAGKRLLLVDACRSHPRRSKEVPAGMSDMFRKLLASAEGQAVLASCSPGERSHENDEFKHGVFTFFLLQALRGAAKPDTNGYITLGSTGEYLGNAVEEWGRQNAVKNDSRYQTPWYQGPPTASAIPLAVGKRETINQFKNQIESVILAMKSPTKAPGGFKPAWLVNLSSALEYAINDQAGRELLTNAQAFAKGTIGEDVFVPYLERALSNPLPPTGSQPPKEVLSYLLPKSNALGNVKDYAGFADRFAMRADNGIRDNMLNKTWFVLPGIKNWDDAQSEAKKRNARLPKLEELQTLITLTPQKADKTTEMYLDFRFFPRLDRTSRCWTSDNSNFISHRIYVDFSVPKIDHTSRSEMLVVMLIRED